MLRPFIVIGCLCPAFLSAADPPDPALVSAARNVRLIVAHRGSSADRPENTLAAYRRAIEGGAGAIEVDLRLTKDGHLVSLHDNRVDRTTNGTGPIESITLEEALQLDAGGWFHERYRGERIPTFQQILQLAKGRAEVFLDLKGKGADYARQIGEEVRRFGEPGSTIAGVRSVEQARHFRRYLPEARQAGLIPSKADIETFVSAGVAVIRFWPDWLADKALVERLRRAGAELHVSADRGTREELIPLLAFRPVSLFTNDPARLVQTLDALKAGR